MSELEELSRRLGPLAELDAPLGALTTYRVGGTARLFVELTGDEALEVLAAGLGEHEVALLVLGKGSNLIVPDAGFEGVAVRLGEGFAGVSIEGSLLRAGGAAAYPVVARRSAAAGLGGMEWAVGIPGSVGGAVVMNAGGHGAETREVLSEAVVLDLAVSSSEPRAMTAADLEFSYRHSVLSRTDLVLEASYTLAPAEAAEASARISEIVRWRRENQPGGQNAGSVFTNPPGDSAGRLIEAAGLKGFRIRTAGVSDKHANFVQADENGSADDVIAVIEEVRRLVAERTGVELATEVRIAGR